MLNHTPRDKLKNLLHYIEGAYAPNTLRAYRTDMLDFIAYCQERNLQAIPADPADIASFLESEAEKDLRCATLRRKVASISAVHRLSDLADPTKSSHVRISLRKIYRAKGVPSGQAFPITKPLLDRLLAVCSRDLRGLRDRALLLLAYDSLRRRTELVSLRVNDMEWQSDSGVSILLRRSKTDQYGSGKWIHLNSETTSALHDWLEASGLKDGFLLRGIDAKNRLTVSLSVERVSKIFKALAERANLGELVVQGISGHSMRVGGAQDLLMQGASLPQIMVKGGWAKTDTAMRYVEKVRLV